MSSMMWSSPIRRSGIVDLSPIPNEIYMEIFIYLRPSDPNEWIDTETRRNFCNLALVCRFFSSVMLPWIFENLQFVEKDSYSQISSTLSSTVSAKFCRNILDGDATALLLAKHVKRWAFSGRPNESKWSPLFLSMYFETFQHMPNLFELSFNNIDISIKDFFKCLVGVSSLETLTLDRCFFPSTAHKKSIKQFQLLPLKRFALVHPMSNKFSPLVPHLNMSYLVRLDLCMFRFVYSLPVSDVNIPLEELSLGIVREFRMLVEFLEKTPYLKVLRLRCFTSEEKNTSLLRPQTIPQLTELHASWSFCRSILPGRPVSRLGLLSMPTNSGAELEISTRSTKPIVQLKIPDLMHVRPTIWEHFPDLEHLELYSLHGDAWGKGIVSAFKGWSRLPKLRFLGLKFHNITPSPAVSQRRQVLEFLVPIFSDLTRVDISFTGRVATSSMVCFDRSALHTWSTWSYTRVGDLWNETFCAKHVWCWDYYDY